MVGRYYEGIGRRKESVARVRISSGSGDFVVNDKQIADYFNRLGDVESILAPFTAINQDQSGFDVSVHVNGGGVTGQTEAVRLGLARALVKMDDTLKPSLSHAGLLTRDPRIKERKKPGLKRARKAPTYTKR
ncbi:MAG TPA: 30S ribosomal protein S9 [Flexilinea sp.]|jgi:small subunit ribosomal protein S9|nr:MAG: 30S ribosomal protein S9 [Chloroflexi bacterium ADurb.Bin344]HNY19944.1 30S ribosomal protein S9 [Flexilinea sp.]HNY93195.1 30S ribosomal protein S9 [Flexilinea sp.]HOG21044.1 30S ribosomal protein S9 [Flexilinea sp.]HOG60132.1 30S ribosomal protein S9 [Flexilinea sp.]